MPKVKTVNRVSHVIRLDYSTINPDILIMYFDSIMYYIEFVQMQTFSSVLLFSFLMIDTSTYFKKNNTFRFSCRHNGSVLTLFSLKREFVQESDSPFKINALTPLKQKFFCLRRILFNSKILALYCFTIFWFKTFHCARIFSARPIRFFFSI